MLRVCGGGSILLKQIAKNNRLYIYIVKIKKKKKKSGGATAPPGPTIAPSLLDTS